jgi:GNAT superfamily N-acetyltransferase
MFAVSGTRCSCPLGSYGPGCKIMKKRFHFRIYKRCLQIVTVSLYDIKGKPNKKIGYIDLYRDYPKSYTTHSFLDDRYHGKGLGVLMYARAIQWCLDNGFQVKSSGNSSLKARRVWKSKSLRELFNIKTHKSTMGSEFDTWHAYTKK